MSDAVESAAPAATKRPVDFFRIPLADIDLNPWNPRQKRCDPARLEDLTKSIAEKGVLEPIAVRAKPAGFTGAPYEIVFGARRFIASGLAGQTDIPAMILDLTDVEALESALAENSQREDVNPVDEAHGYKSLIEAYNGGMTREEAMKRAAARVGHPLGYVYRRLKLLTLITELQAALAEDRLSIGHADRLVRLSPALQEKAADRYTGVLWRFNPLLDDERGPWNPQREDLRPIAELEKFIQEKSFFDPNVDDTTHLQPGLALELAAASGASPDSAGDFDHDDDEAGPAGDDGRAATFDQASANFILLSADPKVKKSLGDLPPGTKIPLAPGKWREVKGPKDRCEFTTSFGLIVHGAPSRVLDCCIESKKCQKHFPAAPAEESKKRPGTQFNAKAEEDRKQKAIEEREAEASWKALEPHARKAFAGHVASVKFSAALVAGCVPSYAIERVREVYGVKLTPKTAAQVLLLATLNHIWNRSTFVRVTKPFRFDLTKVERARKQALQAFTKQASTKGLAQVEIEKLKSAIAEGLRTVEFATGAQTFRSRAAMELLLAKLQSDARQAKPAKTGSTEKGRNVAKRAKGAKRRGKARR